MDTQPLPQLPPGPPPGPPRKKRRTGLIIGVVCGVLLLSACLCGLGSAIAMRGRDDDAAEKKPAVSGPATSAAPRSSPPTSAAPPQATVPNVVGQRLSDAQDVLTAQGFKKISSEDATSQGRVIINSNNWLVRSQSPAAGAKIVKGAAVILKVSKPSDGTEPGQVSEGVVPSVLCQDLQTAQDALQAAGFRSLGSEDGTGKGRAQVIDRNWLVIAQSAAAGSRPAPETRIVLTAVKYGEPTGTSGCKS